MTDFVPAQVFCLAEFIADEMQARGWKTDDVAVRMRGPRGAGMELFILDMLLAVQDDDLLIDDETFEGLARAFDVSPGFLRNLDAMWRKHPDRRCPFDATETLFGPTSRRASFRVVGDTPSTLGDGA